MGYVGAGPVSWYVGILLSACAAIIFVDATDKKRIGVARDELDKRRIILTSDVANAHLDLCEQKRCAE